MDERDGKHRDQERRREPNCYHDSETRYRSEPTFKAAVDFLVAMGEQAGFTPGELRQIAFQAALVIETRNARSVSVARGWPFV